jgi:hypothetical protein
MTSPGAGEGVANATWSSEPRLGGSGFVIGSHDLAVAGRCIIGWSTRELLASATIGRVGSGLWASHTISALCPARVSHSRPHGEVTTKPPRFPRFLGRSRTLNLMVPGESQVRPNRAVVQDTEGPFRKTKPPGSQWVPCSFCQLRWVSRLTRNVLCAPETDRTRPELGPPFPESETCHDLL